MLMLLGYKTSEDWDKVLYEAVSLNRLRILCRIRSKHAIYKSNFAAEKKLQRPRLPLILGALRDPKACHGIASSDFSTLITDAEILSQLSMQLESLTNEGINSELGAKVLVSIIVTCKRLMSRETLLMA